MPVERIVAVFVGSLRRESFNRKAAKAVVELAPPHLKFRFIQIGDLPPYNQDADGDQAPELWTVFRDEVRSADAILFATPEYNRSVPGVLKNAIDVGSRPKERNVFAKKPAAIMSASTGQIGGFGANHHLRQMAVFVDMPVMAQPELYLGPAAQLFGESGEILKDSTRELLKTFIDAFAEWIETVAPEPVAAARDAKQEAASPRPN
jgi:chromate reductase, NAD(P)H dehydrogenase (quinone)